MIAVNVINADGKVIEQVELDGSVFNCDYKNDSPVERFKPIHEVIRWQMNKTRGPIQSIKNRSQISGAHRKVWSQKETGRARQGDGKAPHFRGGGAAFSVNSRDYEFKLNKKYRSLAMRIALSHKLQFGGVFVFEDLSKCDLSKTKLVKSIIENHIKDDRVLFVTTHGLYKDNKLTGLRNLEYVDAIPSMGLNIRSLWDRALIFDKQSIIEVQSRFKHE